MLITLATVHNAFQVFILPGRNFPNFLMTSCSDANPSTSMQQFDYSNGYNVQKNPAFYGQGSSYALLPSQAAYTNTFISQLGSGIQGSYSQQWWSQSKYPPSILCN